MVDILETLNEKQIDAVTTTEGYVRVIAGAGSGKTKTLVSRYVYLVNELGINPSNILCVTFTNKAAQEMRKRVKNMVFSENVGEYICTYHGFCVKLLREDITKLHYPKSFIILDEDDQKSIIKEIYTELGISTSDLTYKKLLNSISNIKISQSYIADIICNTDYNAIKKYEDKRDDIIWKCFVKYIQKQKKGYYLDFDDLVRFALHILSNHEDVLSKWQNRLDYIMVDETQDNSPAQWELVDYLQGYYNNLFIVGDPDQCIYEWRGADPNSLVQFDDKYKPSKTIILNQNYRSTPNILGVANSVIANNQIRIEKDLYSYRDKLADVVHFHGANEFEEGEFISQTIIKHINDGINLSDIAIVYRASYLSRFIEQALIRNKLTYVVYGGVRFFERREIKDILSYLRMADSADDLSFKRTINLPTRKLGKVFISNLMEASKKCGESLYETLKMNIGRSEFNKEGAREYIEIVEEARMRCSSYSISDLAQYILDRTNLTEIYRKDGDEERLENIQELIDTIKLYEQENTDEPDLSLNKYLQDIALYTNLDCQEDSDNIKIMTIHQSKGLEFPIVFVAGMYEGIFPSYRTVKERRKRGLEEERRLAYVAITRAESHLYLTESEGYNIQNSCNKYPSRFLFEIGRAFLIREGVLSNELEEGAKKHIQSIDKALLSESVTLAIGQVIEHTLFGIGEVISIENEKNSVVIQFTDIKRPKHLTLTGIAGKISST